MCFSLIFLDLFGKTGIPSHNLCSYLEDTPRIKFFHMLKSSLFGD